MIRPFRIILLLLAGACLKPEAAKARIMLQPNFSWGNHEDVTETFGEVEYEVSCPYMPENWTLEKARAIANGRGVKVILPKYNDRYRERDALGLLLKDGTKAVLTQCPYKRGDGSDIFIVDDPGFIDIYARTPHGRRHLVHADGLFTLGLSTAYDVYAEQLQKESEDQQRLTMEAQQARQAGVEADQRAQVQQQAVIRQEQQAQAFATFWDWVKAALALGFLVWLWSKRASIARLWYSLTPHPATRLVDLAVNGHDVDVADLKAALAYGGDSPIERQVREEQLAEAAARLATHQANLRAEEERRLRVAQELADRKAEAERQYSLSKGAEALLRTTLEHQATAARVKRLRKQQDQV